MDTTTPLELLEKQLNRIKQELHRAEINQGVIYDQAAFVRAVKLVEDYGFAIETLELANHWNWKTKKKK